jgi:hypothetical protein
VNSKINNRYGGEFLKKKITIFSLLVIVSILLIVSYKNYGRTKANEYLKLLKSIPFMSLSKLDIKDDVQVEKIIKQTPTNLVILIKWGDNEKAYISIENWMTKAHDHIEIDAVDKQKSTVLQE